jgi:hypothetical protein
MVRSGQHLNHSESAMQPPRLQIIDSHIALGVENHLRLEASDYLPAMDSSSVYLAIARSTGAELAVNNRAGNDRVLNAGSRFRALVTANPWYGSNALDELERCRPLGAVGLYLHPTRQGFMPTDPIVEPLIQFARRTNWPVVIHTGTYIESDVLAVAELARRHTDLTFVCDGAGFTDMWFELPGVLAELNNLVLCASLIWSRAVANTVKNIGAHKILFGSGAPRDSLPAAIQRYNRLELSDQDRRAIFVDNAKRVFHLE